MLRLPLTVTASGALRTVSPASAEDLAQAVALLVATPIGERAALPTYGIVDSLGRLSPDLAGIAHAIAAWEPRLTEPTITNVAQLLVDGGSRDTITVAIGIATS